MSETIETAKNTPFRMTLVIEYDNADKCPAVGKEQCRGGTIVAAAFYDALEKLETIETATP